MDGVTFTVLPQDSGPQKDHALQIFQISRSPGHSYRQIVGGARSHIPHVSHIPNTGGIMINPLMEMGGCIPKSMVTPMYSQIPDYRNQPYKQHQQQHQQQQQQQYQQHYHQQSLLSHTPNIHLPARSIAGASSQASSSQVSNGSTDKHKQNPVAYIVPSTFHLGQGYQNKNLSETSFSGQEPRHYDLYYRKQFEQFGPVYQEQAYPIHNLQGGYHMNHQLLFARQPPLPQQIQSSTQINQRPVVRAPQYASNVESQKIEFIRNAIGAQSGLDLDSSKPSNMDLLMILRRYNGDLNLAVPACAKMLTPTAITGKRKFEYHNGSSAVQHKARKPANN